ncbi:hypothetical protein B842_09265 [Corynebacterium humireducens NBRC 106098 = DSM 45392]|uniref:Uncharacterized protein n=1 Tax=Corynebacterium humireducens NBRC 106098 = DSM 45392 TaxID=1223515 RepID=A0A0B5D9M5_9CORY|nr:hypothetical protein [Corynebacterium humireducens]AJE33702.1 hypothetical protein B842_09265 [Corynebacterium humireducens NBRC 106098 = DSM 45392]
MTDYIRELLAGELRRRAPHVVTNPEDCYVYCLADELLAEGHETIRTVPADELDARIQANTLKAAEDYPEDLDDDHDDYDGPIEVGDILATGAGLQIITPTGAWTLTEEDALRLVSRLTRMVLFTLTRNAGPDDPSTILSRGRAALTERN